MQPDVKASWKEADSHDFIDFGAYFVPDREEQIALLCDLIPKPEGPVHLVELCCGEGLLAEALLARFPEATVHAYDGSTTMLETAAARLAGYGERFDARPFDLHDRAWRQFPWPVHAVLSSLAVHHLEGPEKARLFADLYPALGPGGALFLADLVQPVHPEGKAAAARVWDETVRRRSGKNEEAYALFKKERWNYYVDPDPYDHPSPLFDQLRWLAEAGFPKVDVFWMKAGHAIYGGIKGKDEGREEP